MDFETDVKGSILTKALPFCQEGHTELVSRSVHKRRMKNSRKITSSSPLSAKFRTGSPPPCPCEHIIRFLHQKVRTSASKESPCPKNVRTG